MAAGKVVAWKGDRDFGFIKPDEEGPDVFLHITELAEGTPSSRIRSGVRVEYDLDFTDRGPKAVRVRLPLAGNVAVRSSAEVSYPTGECDYLTTEEFGREVEGILDDASMRIQQLAKRHGWVGR